MAKIGKLVREVEIKSDINLVYEIYKHKPNNSTVIGPIQGCDLVSAQWGGSGFVILWRFIHSGKVESAKEMVEEVDDELHKIVFQGDWRSVGEMYSLLILTINIEDMGHKKLVIWTMEFEKVNAHIPDPTPYLDLLCVVVGDMAANFLKRL
ncbi:unnamed protein product [Lactuca saligna]|uniref:Bet v I/Major latex protein domain-containing protein n=1 Tax=Lactuca saligna TaxID=75948 RepID=A0AA35YKC6_LACSI|nr:unnamed protein product [Lactuca saligna]